MACSACERRRESMKKFAVNIFKSPSTKPDVKASAENNSVGQTACTNCRTHVRSTGWVNVCTICGAESVAKPTPHKEKPNCNC